MRHYIKYYLAPFILLFVYVLVVFYELNMWLGLAITFGIVFVGDLILGEGAEDKEFKNKKWLEFPLYLSLPLLAMSHLYLAWYIGQNHNPTWNIIFNELGGAMLMGFIIAGYGTSVGHELSHRVHDQVSVTLSRWLMSLSFNADFSIEHVYGHHVKVGTYEDPATARKGENVYQFFIRSSIGAHKSAWEIEKKRLTKKGQKIFSIRNQMLTGYLMSLTWLAAYGFLGGARGIVMFIISGVYAKFLFEVVNYIEHYGLVRKKGESVKPHHSWNSTNQMSDIVLFSLNRHSSHHERPMKRYWELDSYEQAPQLDNGYLVSILKSLYPSLWFSIMDPKVEAWEKKYTAL